MCKNWGQKWPASLCKTKITLLVMKMWIVMLWWAPPKQCKSRLWFVCIYSGFLWMQVEEDPGPCFLLLSPNTVLLYGISQVCETRCVISAKLQGFGGFEGFWEQGCFSLSRGAVLKHSQWIVIAKWEMLLRSQHLLIITCMFCFYPWRWLYWKIKCLKAWKC